MQEPSDTQLLRDYAEHGHEAAFREIVSRYADVVYASAWRQADSPDLARDIAQSVFTDLARQARERQAMQQLGPTCEIAPEWERVQPVLDEAMAELSDEDREALLLRFFKNRDFREIGRAS